MELEQTAELSDRLGVIVHTQVDIAIQKTTIRSTRAGDVQGRGLPTAIITTRTLPGLKHSHQTLGELAVRLLKSLDHGTDNVAAGKDIPLAGETLAGLMPGPGHTGTAGIGCGLSIPVDNANLPVVTAVIRLDKLAQRCLRGETTLKQSKPFWTVAQVCA